MKHNLVIRIQRQNMDGFVGVRVPKPLEMFFTVAAAVMEDRKPADFMREGLRAQRRKMLSGKEGARLKQAMKRIDPSLIHGL